jgi:hypothetical protein
VYSLLESEWRQGTALPHELLPDGILPLSVTTNTKLVIISHDCDLVNGSYELEPHVELFVARPKPSEARNGAVSKGKNPRRLQFNAEENGEPRLYEIDVHEKYRVGRRILESGTRDKTFKIAKNDVLVIAKWAGRRYYRPSFPTSFMDRVASIKDKLSKKLKKDGEDITYVYAGLNTIEELPPEKPYRLILRVVVPAAVCEDDAMQQRALGVVSEMRKLLAQCPGIEVEDADLAMESEITLADLREMNKWDFDYLSPDEEQPAD